MKLTVLVDNNTYIDQYYLGEPGLSYYIEDEGTKLLLDVGYSDIFLKNAEALGINLSEVDKIVISHGHDDHTKGLKYLSDNKDFNNISIIAHPEAFAKKFNKDLDIGSPYTKEELSIKYNLILSKVPIKVSNNITFLGEIPKSNDFEHRKGTGKLIDGSDDYIYDDTALVYKTENGIYVITGCSHSGICNIIEYAKTVSVDNRVLGVIGGFHLFKINNQVEKTIEYLKKHNIKEFYPCHCTSFTVKAEINKTIPIKEVGVGLEINW